MIKRLVAPRRLRIRVGAAIVVAALAAAAGIVAPAGPASAARIVTTDIQVSIGLVLKNETDIQFSVQFRNLGPEVLTENFRISGITQYRGPNPVVVSSGCQNGSLNDWMCDVTVGPNGLAVNAMMSKTVRFSTRDGCNAGCNILMSLANRFGGQNPDLNSANDDAQIIDGRRG